MEEAAISLLERRWFAMQTATRGLEAECDLLLEAMKLAQAAWQRANRQLAEFEALSDELEEQLVALNTSAVMSAA